jgi:GAF domain-containing protein
VQEPDRRRHGRRHAAARGWPEYTPAFYGDVAQLLDAAQYAADDGPCLTAYRTGETIRIDSIANESARWPALAAEAAEHGIQSSLSLPLVVGGKRVGALNLYSKASARFADESVALGGMFARQAAVALSNAEVYWRTYKLTQNLEAALENRDRIGQAKGILIATRKIDGDEAFDLLRKTSQNKNIKLRDIADYVVRTGELPDGANS